MEPGPGPAPVTWRAVETAVASAAPPRPVHRALQLAGPAAVAGAALGACVVAGVLNPERTTMGPPCAFRAVTGWYCPGCGMTRGLHRLLHGDVIAAVQYNLLLVVLVPVALYSILAYAANTYGWFDGRLKQITMPRHAWTVAIVALATWAVLRNTPLPFFDLLARGRI